jgi:hypothetical protein
MKCKLEKTADIHLQSLGHVKYTVAGMQQDFNTKLSERAKLFGHADLVEMKFDRKYFTKHGFHLNNVGKDKLAKVIALQINKIMKPSLNDKFVIPLQWKYETTNNSSTVNTSHIPS